MLVGSAHDLETPALPILTLLITFHDHGVGLDEGIVPRCLKAGVGLPFRVLDEATRRPDVEVVQSRVGLMPECVMRLVGRMPGARRTALIVPPSEVVTLARSSWSLAHADIERRRAGFLMT